MASNSKAHFQNGKVATSKLSASGGGAGNTKKGGNTNILAGNETTGGGRTNNIQVIHNGKIATPVSLHARPKATASKQTTNGTSAPVAVAAIVTDAVGIEEEKSDKTGMLGKPSANTRRYVPVCPCVCVCVCVLLVSVLNLHQNTLTLVHSLASITINLI